MQQIIRLIAASLIFIILPAHAAQLAGEITAAMGEARIVASAGGQRAAVQGMPLHVGDILQTGAGGHIHIRMIDDALVSLRPDSELKIDSYTYQPGVAATTKIRLDLLRGTIRSVTGKGGELAKDRFRMNTPVAAIGVRGTDFIAHADAEKTLVNVQMGAIVLAPLGEGCQASALGPCQTSSARTLTAEMRNMMLEFTRGMSEPHLVPLSEGMQIMVPPTANGAAAKSPLTVSAYQSGDAPVNIELQRQSLDNLAAQQNPVAQQGAVSLSGTAATVATAAAVTVHHQMVWGRYWGGTASDNDLDRAYADAAQGREVTVGTAATGLFRDAGKMILPPGGRTQFALRQAQVSLPQATGAVPGVVQSGTLGVDFNLRQFDTQLNIQHPSLAATATLNAAGIVRDDGIFLSRAARSNGWVAGSLSRDAAEAGYLFELPTVAGTLNGTTLWVK